MNADNRAPAAAMDLTVRLPGLTLKNPILTASGTFGYGLEFKRYGDLAALGGIVVKGLSLKPRAGNPTPRVVETPCGMLNAIGIQNIGAEAFLKDKLPFLPWKDTAVIVNLYACEAAEFGDLAGLFAGVEGVAALEVNVSCPNVAQGGMAFGQDLGQLRKVAEEVKKRAGSKPVIVKLSPNVTDIGQAARAAVDGGADMLSLINTLAGMAVDIRRRTPRLANVIGGLSGPAVKPVALRCAHQVRRAVNVPLIGIGGIVTPQDVCEFLLVGAHAVQIGTATFMRPDAAFRIAADLPQTLADIGAGSLDSYRGSLKA